MITDLDILAYEEYKKWILVYNKTYGSNYYADINKLDIIYFISNKQDYRNSYYKTAEKKLRKEKLKKIID